MRVRGAAVPAAVILAAAGLVAAVAPACGMAAAPARPVFVLAGPHELTVSSLPDVLSNREVRPRLTSGLTTSLVMRARTTDARGRRLDGGAVVEIRYEPWDEVFLASALGGDGRRRQESLPTFDRLVAWWRGLKLPLLAPGSPGSNGALGSSGSLGSAASNGASGATLPPGGPWRVELTLDVIPFSRAEQSETQTWLSQSLAEQRDGVERAAAGNAAPPSTAAAPAGMLEMLVATSIKRRSVISFEWEGVARAASPAAGDGERRP